MTGQKIILKYQRYFKYIGIAFLLMITLCGISSAKTNIERTTTVDMNKFHDVTMLEVKAGEILNVEIQVTSGGAVDLLLMKTSNYEDYKNAITQRGTINIIEEGSSKGITSKKYTYTFKESGDYHLVIDNTDVPKGGGSPMDQVEMNLKVKVEAAPMETPSTSDSTPSTSVPTPSSTQPPKTSGFEAILASFVIIMVALRKK